jgi:L-fucose mutarotase/ribose pyranase (RbsD/FucU family)
MKVLQIVVVAAIMAIMALPCNAALKTVGKGDKLTFDPSNFPANMKQSWEMFKVKCIKCHTMERTVVSIMTGVAPISGQPFDRNATKAYGIKMMRKPDSNMNKQEAKASVDLMNWMMDEASR